jgi:copper chaperone
MERTTLKVSNISCGHCVMAIQRRLGETEGVYGVEGDLERREITVEWDAPATLKKIKAALEEISYPAED